MRSCRFLTPGPVYFDGQRLPASYANFYIANKLVLVPTFNDVNDRIALNTLAKLFPDRNVIGIHAVDLVLGTRHTPLHDATTNRVVGYEIMPSPIFLPLALAVIAPWHYCPT